MNHRLSFLFGVLFSLATMIQPEVHAQSLQRYEFKSRQMGTTFKLILYAPHDSIAIKAQQRAFHRVETLNNILSDYDPESELNELSSKSGTGEFFAVDSTLFTVLSSAQTLAEATDGAFDVTIGPLVSLWRKIRNEGNPQLPSSDTLAALKSRVGYHYLRLNRSSQSVALTHPDMQLDLGGIAKGFAADEMLRVVTGMGLNSVLVDAGGDIRLGDPPPGKATWTVTIPAHNQDGNRKWIALQLANQAVATSGDLYQHVTINGSRYSHIIDPFTGLGLTDQSMVTIVAPDGMTADSYASAISVLGASEGLKVINSKPHIELRIEYRSNKGVEIKKTSAFDELTQE